MKTLLHNSQSGSELEFAYQVRRALDERVNALPSATTTRLMQARQVALARKKPQGGAYAVAPERRLASVFSLGGSLDHSMGWLGRLGIALPLLVLILGSVGIYQYEQDRRINDLAELDVAVLSDELPLTAFLDHGFDTFLSKHGE